MRRPTPRPSSSSSREGRYPGSEGRLPGRDARRVQLSVGTQSGAASRRRDRVRQPATCLAELARHCRCARRARRQSASGSAHPGLRPRPLPLCRSGCQPSGVVLSRGRGRWPRQAPVDAPAAAAARVDAGAARVGRRMVRGAAAWPVGAGGAGGSGRARRGTRGAFGNGRVRAGGEPGGVVPGVPGGLHVLARPRPGLARRGPGPVPDRRQLGARHAADLRSRRGHPAADGRAVRPAAVRSAGAVRLGPPGRGGRRQHPAAQGDLPERAVLRHPRRGLSRHLEWCSSSSCAAGPRIRTDSPIRTRCDACSA